MSFSRTQIRFGEQKWDLANILKIFLCDFETSALRSILAAFCFHLQIVLGETDRLYFAFIILAVLVTFFTFLRIRKASDFISKFIFLFADIFAIGMAK